LILPDVNVLIGAFRADSPHHRIATPFLEAAVRTGRPFGISPLALSAVLRITTTPRFHAEPSTPGEFFTFADAFLSQPNCVVIEAQRGHWAIFRQLVTTANVRSKLVPDAWFAALAIEHGCEWVTLDKDFSRFAGLKWRLLS